MAEAVGFVSALLSLTILAYDTSKSLYEVVSSFRSQRRTINDLQIELNSLVIVLGSIRTQAEDSEVQRLEPLRQPLECCSTICQEIHGMLEACTKHAAQGRDSVWDWLNMRYQEKSFEDIQKRLASYQRLYLSFSRPHKKRKDFLVPWWTNNPLTSWFGQNDGLW